MKVRVAVYTRVSSPKQSTQMQIDDILDYCKYKKFEDITMFEDIRTGKTTNRIALRKMLKRLNEFNVIIIWKLDRMFRSLQDLLNTLATLKMNDVELVVLKDRLNINTKEGRLMMQMLGAVAEFEAELIKERVTSGVRNAIARKGTWGVKSSVDFKRVLELRDKKHTIREIAVILEEEGNKTSKSNIQRLLKKYGDKRKTPTS